MVDKSKNDKIIIKGKKKSHKKKKLTKVKGLRHIKLVIKHRTRNNLFERERIRKEENI